MAYGWMWFVRNNFRSEEIEREFQQLLTLVAYLPEKVESFDHYIKILI